METLEFYRGEIFELYIGQNMRLKDVLSHLKQTYNLDVSPKQLNVKLDKWNYYKNLKRAEVVQAVRQIAQRDGTEAEYPITVRQRPVDRERVEKHRKRAGLPTPRNGQALQHSRNLATAMLYQAPPPALLSYEWRVPEKLLHDIDVMIKGSLETHQWRFRANEQLIFSSPNETVEKTNLQEFLADIDSGCAAADLHDFAKAGKFWRQGFLRVEDLIAAQYHDVIPNLIQKLNDLNRLGRVEVAAMLKKHIADSSRTINARQALVQHSEAGSSLRSHIYTDLGALEMAQLPGFEARVMELFRKLFHFYLGPVCYSSFVMMMNAARRQLYQAPWATFADHLPDISELEAFFGESNRRTMDVISLRAEVMYRRRQYEEVEGEAQLLIHRANMIVNDEWQRFYNLVRGYYFLGSAQYHRGKTTEAKENLVLALWADRELCAIDDFSIFNAEKEMIKKYLDDLDRAVDIPVEDISHVGTEGEIFDVIFEASSGFSAGPRL